MVYHIQYSLSQIFNTEHVRRIQLLTSKSITSTSYFFFFLVFLYLSLQLVCSTAVTTAQTVNNFLCWEKFYFDHETKFSKTEKISDLSDIWIFFISWKKSERLTFV